MNTITSVDLDPVQQAREIYNQEFCPRSFDEDLYLHLNNPHAIVYKDKHNLALLRPVNRNDTYQQLTHPKRQTDNPNCWWVYLLVGDFRFLLSLLPYPLPYIGWERNNVPRSYKLDHLKRWTSKDPISITPSLIPADASPDCTKEAASPQCPSRQQPKVKSPKLSRLQKREIQTKKIEERHPQS